MMYSLAISDCAVPPDHPGRHRPPSCAGARCCCSSQLQCVHTVSDLFLKNLIELRISTIPPMKVFEICMFLVWVITSFLHFVFIGTILYTQTHRETRIDPTRVLFAKIRLSPNCSLRVFSDSALLLSLNFHLSQYCFSASWSSWSRIAYVPTPIISQSIPFRHTLSYACCRSTKLVTVLFSSRN